jgi:hypothetical protein
MTVASTLLWSTLLRLRREKPKKFFNAIELTRHCNSFGSYLVSTDDVVEAIDILIKNKHPIVYNNQINTKHGWRLDRDK